MFRALYLVGLIVGSTVRGICTRRYRPSAAADERRSGLDSALRRVASVGLLVLPLVYVLTPWLDFADYGLPMWTGGVGGVVFAAAVWLLWRFHVDLGRNWSSTLQVNVEHTLVTQGVYRQVRHPMYAAHWLWAVAQLLLLHNWIAGPALLVLFLPLYILRVRREEQMMLDHFGEEYRAYIKRTGRVLPLSISKYWGKSLLS